MTLDPIFVPADNNEAVTNQVELKDYVDPLQYWGCSSRTAMTDEQRDHLPDGQTQLKENQLSVSHPSNWVHSEFPGLISGTVHIFAPEEADLEVVEDAFLGKIDFPMLMITDFHTDYRTGEYLGRADTHLQSQLGIAENIPIPGGKLAPTTRSRFLPFQYEFLASGVVFNILTSEEDWELNKAMYDAMIAHLDTYQYYLDEKLEHTLILGDYNQKGILVGYPDKWFERVNSEGVIEISHGIYDESLLPKVQLFAFNQINPDDSTNVDSILTQLAQDYTFSINDLSIEESMYGVIQSNQIEITQGNRKGYMQIAEPYIVIATATNEDLEVMEADLLAILASVNVDEPYSHLSDGYY
jgi:hypothetical protein